MQEATLSDFKKPAFIFLADLNYRKLQQNTGDRDFKFSRFDTKQWYRENLKSRKIRNLQHIINIYKK